MHYHAQYKRGAAPAALRCLRERLGRRHWALPAPPGGRTDPVADKRNERNRFMGVIGGCFCVLIFVAVAFFFFFLSPLPFLRDEPPSRFPKSRLIEISCIYPSPPSPSACSGLTAPLCVSGSDAPPGAELAAAARGRTHLQQRAAAGRGGRGGRSGGATCRQRWAAGPRPAGGPRRAPRAVQRTVSPGLCCSGALHAARCCYSFPGRKTACRRGWRVRVMRRKCLGTETLS